MKVDSGRTLIGLQLAMSGKHNLVAIGRLPRQAITRDIGEEVPQIGSNPKMRKHSDLHPDAVVEGEAIVDAVEISNSINARIGGARSGHVAEVVSGHAQACRRERHYAPGTVVHRIEDHVVEEVVNPAAQCDWSGRLASQPDRVLLVAVGKLSSPVVLREQIKADSISVLVVVIEADAIEAEAERWSDLRWA